MATVLVVEDDEDTLEMMTKIVGHFGYRSLSARSAEAALAILATEKPDIMIVDGMMPGMNGTEFVRLCRANQDAALIPIVLYTAMTDEQFSNDAVAKGASEVWHKGKVGIDYMRDRIQHYLKSGHARGAS